MLIRPRLLYTAAGVRELDRRAIEDHGIDGYRLMERAATAVFRLLCLRWPSAHRIGVFCGGGNNGGDGLVVARLARSAGLRPRVFLAGDPGRLKGAAARALEDWLAAGGTLDETVDPVECDVVVDALLGTGLDRSVRDDVAALIEHINAAARPVLAVDVPSGIDADTGAVRGMAVRADATISFIGAKRGLYTGDGLMHAGACWLDDLEVPASVYAGVDPVIFRATEADARAVLPRRRPQAHKGDGGRVLVVGGNHGMGGAARLAGEAALRSGAGLVSVATRAEHVGALLAARPELMVRALADPAVDLSDMLEAADVIVLGPGLGGDEWAHSAVETVLAARLPCVIDADALNLLAPLAADGPQFEGDSVITPHPGEAARLLAMDTAEITADRFAAAGELCRRSGAVALLKGAGTLVATADQRTTLVGGASPALATGGTGDILAGVIGGLRAQGVGAGDAAVAGAWLHSAAGERAALGRRTGMLAGELLPWLGRLRDSHGDD